MRKILDRLLLAGSGLWTWLSKAGIQPDVPRVIAITSPCESL